MNTSEDIRGFVAEKALAVAGISRDPGSFSASAWRALKRKGFTLYPVNPATETIHGERCFASLAKLPAKVGGVLVFTPPARTAQVVRDAIAAGIRRVWIQQGAESDEAVGLCREAGLAAVTRQCILMYVEPVGSIHAFHRWVKRLFGGMPK